MNTRSQTRYENSKPLYEVEIDFDEASEAWRQNKKHVGQGHFKYICTIPLAKKHGEKCGNSCYKDSQYCWAHRGYNTNTNINTNNK
jgi:hypothetical protein